jgi:anti-anti-sigma factor
VAAERRCVGALPWLYGLIWLARSLAAAQGIFPVCGVLDRGRNMTSVEPRGKGASIRFEWKPEPFNVEVLPDRQRVVVVPRGEVDIGTVDRLAGEIEELVGRGFDTVVLDLRATSFLDSSGLHLLLRQSARTDAQVTVIDGTPAVSRVIDLAGVRHLLRFEAAP